mmetsp:Transcript_12069/g.21631  ORF Transcript_12069/g.21631 Transcript_12069/m.21631 type:complete len:209 (-) Transcript_12069:2654-3280(-)
MQHFLWQWSRRPDPWVLLIRRLDISFLFMHDAVHLHQVLQSDAAGHEVLLRHSRFLGPSVLYDIEDGLGVGQRIDLGLEFISEIGYVHMGAMQDLDNVFFLQDGLQPRHHGVAQGDAADTVDKIHDVHGLLEVSDFGRTHLEERDVSSGHFAVHGYEGRGEEMAHHTIEGRSVARQHNGLVVGLDLGSNGVLTSASRRHRRHASGGGS